MTLWIVLGIVVVALLLLGVLAFEVVGHLTRLRRTVETARGQALPQVQLLISLMPAELPSRRSSDDS